MEMNGWMVGDECEVEVGAFRFLGRRLLLATLARLCYTFHYESRGGWAATTMPGPRIFQFSFSNSRHFDVRLPCLLQLGGNKRQQAFSMECQT